MEGYKQVIIVRQDLKLSAGKLCAQVAHASLGSFKKVPGKLSAMWDKQGSKKVVLKTEDLKTMVEIYEEAKRAGLACFMVKDAGRTQIPPGTITAVGIGPDDEEKIDKVAGKLKML